MITFESHGVLGGHRQAVPRRSTARPSVSDEWRHGGYFGSLIGTKQVAAPERGSAAPYATIIAALLERENLRAARTVLAIAVEQQPENAELRRMETILRPPRAKRVTEAHPSQSLPNLETLRPYTGKWVAASNGEVVAAAASLQSLLTEIASRIDRPVVHFVKL